MARGSLVTTFKQLYPVRPEMITSFEDNGPRSIRVKLVTGQILIFTFINHERWKIETAGYSFTDRKIEI